MKSLRFFGYLALIISSCSYASQYDEMTRKNISQIAAGLPSKLDRYTTLTGIFLQPNKVIVHSYTYDVDLEFSDESTATNTSISQLKSNGIEKYGSYLGLINAWGEEKRRFATNSICTNPDIIGLMGQGYSISHIYYDTHGAFMHSYEVSIKSC
ncbi:hypothetical protein D3C84_724540 [compost metagenome]